MFHKPFDQQLHQKYDTCGKHAVREIFFNTIVFRVVEPEDKYAVDFFILRGDKRVGSIEVEVKDKWIGDKYPYPDVHFLERKIKYSSTNCLWVLFNRDCTHHLLIGVKQIKGCQIRKQPNRLSQGQTEAFYVIPTSQMRYDGLYNLIRYEEQKQFGY